MYKCDLYAFIRLSKNRHRPDQTPQRPQGKTTPGTTPESRPPRPREFGKNYLMTVDKDKDDSDKDKKDML